MPVLGDQLLHLSIGVGAGPGHMFGNVGDLSPGHQAKLVTQVIHVLIVLIVGQTDGVGSHLPDDGHILRHHGGGQGAAHTLPVLVPGDTVKRVGYIIEQEASLGVEGDGPAAEGEADLILHFAVFHQLSGQRIQERVLHSVPLVGLDDGKICIQSLSGGDDPAGGPFRNGITNHVRPTAHPGEGVNQGVVPLHGYR